MKDITQIQNLIDEYIPEDSIEIGFKQRIMGLLNLHGLNAFSNENFDDGHITGSAFVFDTNKNTLLLLHHKKLNRWLQPGGHSDGSSDVLETAKREIYEETGITEINTNGKIFDIDIHLIPAKEGKHPEHYHYDIRFLFLSDSTVPPVLNVAETNEIKWIDLQEIYKYVSNEDITIKRVIKKLENIKKDEKDI